jgi:hypothetical protein
MLPLLALLKIIFSPENKVNNKDIEFTVVDDDTIRIKETKNINEDINIRVFTKKQLEMLHSS